MERSRTAEILKWLHPGMQVKRWLLLLFVGVLLCGLGVAILMVQLYREVDFPGASGRVVYILFLEFIGPRWIRATILVAFGVVAGALAVWGFNQALLTPFAEGRNVGELLLQRKQL